MIETRGYTNDLTPGKACLPLLTRTYSSVMDFCVDAKKAYPRYRGKNHATDSYFDSNDPVFTRAFAGCGSWKEIEDLCRDGWERDLPEMLDIVEAAVKLVEMEIEQFEPYHAVTGVDVDVAAAIAGLPEDMLDYPLTRVSNVGTTITVLCDVQCHAGVSARAIEKRGMVIAGLALALDSCGHQTELWLSDEYTKGKSRVILRTLVKGPNDFIDPAKIMYAYAHPSVQRGLGFVTVAGLPDPWNKIAGSYGYVSGITKDMPEGCLYIEPMFRYNDSGNLDKELKMYLSQLGLLANEDY